MAEIRCPRCGEVFQVDETGYAQIVKQVRDREFDEELRRRAEAIGRERDQAARLARAEAARKADAEAAESARRIDELTAKVEELSHAGDLAARTAAAEARQRAEADASAARDRLRAEAEAERRRADERAAAEAKGLRERIEAAEREASRLGAELERQKTEARLAQTEAERRAEADAAGREQRITELTAKVDELSRATELATRAAAAEARREAEAATAAAERERDEARSELAREREGRASDRKASEAAHALEIERERRANRELVRYKDEEIERLRDLKARLSTKMVGETLEQHCETEFNRLRATAFPHAYFEKDNDASAGTKGDYIFREADADGTELVSIMFEMKNEGDDTASKHRNEDFFKKLDHDRAQKGCEYAVLVTLLEPESELYNQGIVDVSYRYPKMYVIRPQFFIPMITLLRNAAGNALEARRELALARRQNIDVTNFEEKLTSFQDGFARNYGLASRRFNDAIEEIDKTITHLQKVKDGLLSSDRNLRLANDKAQGLTIKRLTRGNKTMKGLFDEARAAHGADAPADGRGPAEGDGAAADL